MEPMDVPKVGRIAVLRDPQGATFGIISRNPLHSSPGRPPPLAAAGGLRQAAAVDYAKHSPRSLA